jgi:hypothetical protein
VLLNGYAPVVQVREGRLFFARSLLDGPIFQTRQEAQDRCFHIIMDNAERAGPLAEATITPFKGWWACWN